MAVRKLFWDDPYLTECRAVVTNASGRDLTLDRTIAFAFSGGQESDRGTIGGAQIVSARAEGLEIVYTLPDEHGLKPGAIVDVRIDWGRRYRLMRLHFAAELVLELMNQHFDRPTKLGAHIAEDKARVDFCWDGNIAETFPTIAPEVERLVAADLPIRSAFADEAMQRRYWEIEGFASVECGGTHLRHTGEVGATELRRDNRGRGIERIVIRLAE